MALLDRTSEVRRTPSRPRRLVLVSALVGLLIAVSWSAELVDSVIGDAIAVPLLGGDPATVPVTGSTAAVLLAFVTGLAGTFTACNVAVVSALVPTAGSSGGVRALLRPLGILVGCAVAVSAVYGAVVVLTGDLSLQVTNSRVGELPGRLVQAGVVFTVIGAILVWRGLAAVGIARDRVSELLARRPDLDIALLGVLVGAFVIGRPFPPFRHMLTWAVENGDPLLGAGLLALQTLGNLALLVLVVVLVAALTRGRALRWLTASPQRAARISAAVLVAAGTFFLVYWGVATFARAGVIWWPYMPWTWRG
ncbi:hypothetical protein [Actinomycetospora atypica]|uniref:Cytochrome C biogenesis protein transmembrane domain-containing protein n=1 Tax=Actinomycetospora atypica TaxID=1290095 RepID=A0ABV9YPL1_9PSEU